MEFNYRPSKEQIRKWLAERWQKRDPIPDAEHIRRQLGWAAAQAHRGSPHSTSTPEQPPGPRPT